MGLFGRKDNRIVWRDKSGEIVCLGDSCPQNYDDPCQIYLNIEAVMVQLAIWADNEMMGE